MSNKLRVKQTVTHNHSYAKGAGKMLGMLNEFAKTWEDRQKELVEKHNQMAAQLAAQEALTQQIAEFSAAEFGKMQARLNLYFQSIDAALHHHDVNDIAASELLKELFGQLTQADLFFKKLHASTVKNIKNTLSNTEGQTRDFLDLSAALELNVDEVAEIKRDTLRWYEDLLKSAFKTANETVEHQRNEAEKARKEEQAHIAAEKEKAAAEKSEAERMEAEFQRSEKQDRGISQVTGNTEQESLGLPPDVRVFGMT